MTIDIDWFLKTVALAIRDKHVPVVDLIAVQTKDPFKVLVATILSARTKDETTAKASARLFKYAPDADSLAMLSEEKIVFSYLSGRLLQNQSQTSNQLTGNT